MYIIFSKVNGCFEEINGNKYLTLLSTNERKEKMKEYEEFWSKIGDLIMLITKSIDYYDEKYMKIKFNSDNELPLNKTTKSPNMTLATRAVFHEKNKYYPHVFLDECLYKL